MLAALLAILAIGVALAPSGWPGALSHSTDTGGAATPPAAPGEGDVEVAPGSMGSSAGPWSPGTEPGTAAERPGTAEGTPADGAPTCDVTGCALWRSTVLDQRPLLAGDGRLVHLGLELLIAVDADTGQWLWRRGHTDPRGVSPAAAITAGYLDDRTLVIAYGTRLRIHAADTGSVLGEADLAPTQITDVRRHDGQLIATGRVRGADSPRTRVVGLADDGRVRFDTEVERLPREAAPASTTTAPLLGVADGDLLRLDATEGHPRWRRSLEGRQVDGSTLLDPATGELVVVGTRDGRDLVQLRRPGAVAAGVRDGLLAVTFADRVELYDRDGTGLGEVGVSDPRHTVLAAAGRRVTVAELPAEPGGSLTVRTGRRSGGATALPTTTRSTTVPLPPGDDPAEVLAMRRGDGLLLAGPAPANAWIADPVGGTVRSLDLALGPRAEVQHTGGLTLVRDGQRVTVIGPGGSVRVHRATQVAATDPLVLHGGSGVLRLDRAPLDGPRAERGPGITGGAVTAGGRPPPTQRPGQRLAR